jgi:hypothetical protein
MIGLLLREKALPRVMEPLTYVTRSGLTDGEAAERLRPDVTSSRRATRYAIEYVLKVREHDDSYLVDRAYRVLCAAVAGTAPLAVKEAHRSVFEQQRRLLCDLTLGAAFNELAVAVPGLEGAREQARAKGFKEPARPNQLRGFFFAEFLDLAHELVGPDSGEEDPLMRSMPALHVAVGYLNGVAGVTSVPDPERPLFDWDDPAATKPMYGDWRMVLPWHSNERGRRTFDASAPWPCSQKL